MQALIGFDFDVELTGFEMGEIDLVLHDADEAKGETGGPEDDVPEPQPDGIVSKLGDLWVLGKHRLLCGDVRSMACYEQLLDGEKADLVITDPPYNVAIDDHATGKGAIRHRGFVMASGEMSKDAFTAFLTTVFRCLVAYTADGSIHFTFMDWRHIDEIMTAGREAYTELKNLCVWSKSNAGMGSFYRSQHELVFVWKSGEGPHKNNVELGQHGRNRSNVWHYAGVNTFRPGRLEELKQHPTVNCRLDRRRDQGLLAAGRSSGSFLWQRHHFDCRRTDWPHRARARIGSAICRSGGEALAAVHGQGRSVGRHWPDLRRGRGRAWAVVIGSCR